MRAECCGGEVDPTVRKVFINVAQDVGSLHRRSKRTSGAIRFAFMTRSDAEHGGHQSTNRPRNLIAVVRRLLIGCYPRPSKVGAHASEEVVHRVARKIWVSARKVVQDEQLTADFWRVRCSRANLFAARPCFDGGDAPLRRVARASTSTHVNIYEIVECAQDEIEEFNIAADLVGEESCGEGEAARDAVDGLPRLWEECVDLWAERAHGATRFPVGPLA